MEKKMVVITTDKDRRGVFFGELVSYDADKQYAILKDAQMAIYWSAETKGVLGLASHGPQKGSRISPIIPRIELNGVTSKMDVSNNAIKQWRAKLWD